MLKILVLLSTVFFTLSANATQPTSSSIDLLLSVTKTEKMLDSMYFLVEKSMNQYLAESLKDKKLSPTQKRLIDAAPSKFTQVMREEMSWEMMRPLYIQIYQESFTQEEIDGLIAFYKSPAGSAFVEKMPVVMQKSMSVMQSRMGPMMEKMQAAMNQAIAEAKAAK